MFEPIPSPSHLNLILSCFFFFENSIIYFGGSRGYGLEVDTCPSYCRTTAKPCLSLYRLPPVYLIPAPEEPTCLLRPGLPCAAFMCLRLEGPQRPSCESPCSPQTCLHSAGKAPFLASSPVSWASHILPGPRWTCQPSELFRQAHHVLLWEPGASGLLFP